MNKEELNQEYIYIKSKSTLAKLPMEDVLFLERNQRSTIIYCCEREYRTNTPFNIIAESLRGDFFRAHSGCIINLKNIRAMKDGLIAFQNTNKDLRYIFGKHSYQATRNAYREYLEREIAKCSK